MIVHSQPLVTVVLVSYNQEKYIHEALSSILNQTYKNIQIIISDDFSKDNTYLIIKNKLGSLVDGNKIILRRSQYNRGATGHLNDIIPFIRGDWVVLAAGDDISMPNRVTEIVKAVKKNGKTTCIFSNAKKINSAGVILDSSYFQTAPEYADDINSFREKKWCWIFGASASYSAKLFMEYEKLNEDNFQEDGALAFRAILEGKIEYINEPLIYYREGGVSNSNNLDYRIKFFKNRITLVKAWIRDFIYSKKNFSILFFILIYIYLISLLYFFLSFNNMFIKIAYFIKGKKNGGY